MLTHEQRSEIARAAAKKAWVTMHSAKWKHSKAAKKAWRTIRAKKMAKTAEEILENIRPSFAPTLNEFLAMDEDAIDEVISNVIDEMTADELKEELFNYISTHIDRESFWYSHLDRDNNEKHND